MKRFLRWVAAVLIFSGGFYLLGDRHDIWLWIYEAAFMLAALYAVLSIEEDLARERFTPPEPGADTLPLRLIRIVALAHLVIGLLDNRFHWTTMPLVLRPLGIIGVVVCFLFLVRAMKANRFFSAVVRIQKNRGHAVVDRGPYAVIRHPGYAAMLPLMISSGLAFGSWLATAVGFIYAALIARRIVFEDGYLRRNLSGYAEYSARVRYRLWPGVW